MPTTFVIGGDSVIQAVLAGYSASYRKRLVDSLRKTLGVAEEPKPAAAPDDPTAKSAKRLVEMARDLLARGRAEEAASGLERALVRRSQDTELLVMLGDVLLRLSKGEESQRRFQQALELAPDDRNARRGLAKARAIADQDLDGAERALRAEIKKPPVDPALYYYLGHLCERRGNYAGAAGAYRTAYERLLEHKG